MKILLRIAVALMVMAYCIARPQVQKRETECNPDLLEKLDEIYAMLVDECPDDYGGNYYYHNGYESGYGYANHSGYSTSIYGGSSSSLDTISGSSY